MLLKWNITIFLVDANESGSGNLEIIINGGRVVCRVKELGTRQFLATFTPTQAIPHLIEMRFNNEQVGSWNVPIRSESASYQNGKSSHSIQQHTSTIYPNEEEQYSELTGLGLHRAQVGRTSFFDITTSIGQLQPSDVTVRMFGKIKQ